MTASAHSTAQRATRGTILLAGRSGLVQLAQVASSLIIARVVVPGLCDDRPASWRPRLLEVPIRLGWRDAGFCERDLNGAPLLI